MSATEPKTKKITCTAAKATQSERAFEVVTQGLKVSIQVLEKEIIVTGNGSLDKAVEVLNKIIASKVSLSDNDVLKMISELKDAFNHGNAVIDIRKAAVKARTKGHIEYIGALNNDDNAIVTAFGPAGSGKTFLAIAKAVEMLQKQQVDKIILCRPAVEAGEKLGTLPGDKDEKLGEFLVPLLDSLNQLMTPTEVTKLRTDKKIEIVPVGQARGRNFTRAAVVIDEAQNTTPMQIRMLLTRLHEKSRIFVCGDRYQSDMPAHSEHGLDYAIRVFKDIQGMNFVQLQMEDVVRHPVVAAIEMAAAEDRKQQMAKGPANDRRPA